MNIETGGPCGRMCAKVWVDNDDILKHGIDRTMVRTLQSGSANMGGNPPQVALLGHWNPKNNLSRFQDEHVYIPFRVGTGHRKFPALVSFTDGDSFHYESYRPGHQLD